jgi:hypothetical protein
MLDGDRRARRLHQAPTSTLTESPRDCSHPSNHIEATFLVAGALCGVVPQPGCLRRSSRCHQIAPVLEALMCELRRWALSASARPPWS